MHTLHNFSQQNEILFIKGTLAALGKCSVQMSHTILLKNYEDSFIGSISENRDTLRGHLAGMQVVPHKAARTARIASKMKQKVSKT